MARKNSLEAKRARKATKKYDRGYPNFFVHIEQHVDNQVVNRKLVTFYKANRVTQPQHINGVGAAFFYGNILEKLGLSLDTLNFTLDATWVKTNA